MENTESAAEYKVFDTLQEAADYIKDATATPLESATSNETMQSMVDFTTSSSRSKSDRATTAATSLVVLATTVATP